MNFDFPLGIDLSLSCHTPDHFGSYLNMHLQAFYSPLKAVVYYGKKNIT